MTGVGNPFKVFTPEDLDTETMMDLFFEVPYLNNIQDPGNTVLNGPRGSGKSMLLRYLKADCQMADRDVPVRDLPFFGVLVSIKKAVNLTELRRLEDYTARVVLGEHALTTYVGARLFESTIEAAKDLHGAELPEVEALHEYVVRRMRAAGGAPSDAEPPPRTVLDLLKHCQFICEEAYSEVNQFAKRLVFSTRSSYGGALCDYLTFLYPTIRRVQSLPFMPGSGQMFLMFDDADHLEDAQARVLNSWLVARTQGDVSLKVAAQRHKTLMTVNGGQARSPHDFQQIDIAAIYTTKRGQVYFKSVQGIVQKRLERAGINASPEKFFPPNARQEAAIELLKQKYREEWEVSGRGHRASDDVLRYARPEYMRQLGGSSKSTSTFYYAGFGELVHISSGQVRYFLEPAAKMFDQQKGRNGKDEVVDLVDPAVQSAVLREEANALMYRDLDDLKRNAADRANIDGLRNLIEFLGGFFRQKLMAPKPSERRVFSVAVTGGPEPDVAEVLDLGIYWGYFHASSIGNKDGTGRVRLYVLTRRLAPYFNLDPSSFAGYQFFTNRVLRKAISGRPDVLLNVVKQKGLDWVEDDQQLEIF